MMHSIYSQIVKTILIFTLLIGIPQKCIHSSFHRNDIVVVHCIPFKIYILHPEMLEAAKDIFSAFCDASEELTLVLL